MWESRQQKVTNLAKNGKIRYGIFAWFFQQCHISFIVLSPLPEFYMNITASEFVTIFLDRGYYWNLDRRQFAPLFSPNIVRIDWVINTKVSEVVSNLRPNSMKIKLHRCNGRRIIFQINLGVILVLQAPPSAWEIWLIPLKDNLACFHQPIYIL